MRLISLRGLNHLFLASPRAAVAVEAARRSQVAISLGIAIRVAPIMSTDMVNEL
jgi:hypothetical protein